MTIEKLIEELNERKEQGYTDVQGLLFLENGGDGLVINVQWDSDCAYTKEIYM